MLTFKQVLDEIKLANIPESFETNHKLSELVSLDEKAEENHCLSELHDNFVNEADEGAKREYAILGGRRVPGADFAAHLAYLIADVYNDYDAARFDETGVFKYFYSKRIYGIVEFQGYHKVDELLSARGDLDELAWEFYNNLGDAKFKAETVVLCDALLEAMKVCAKFVGDPDYEEYEVCHNIAKSIKRFASSGKLKNALAKYPKIGGHEWSWNASEHMY